MHDGSATNHQCDRSGLSSSIPGIAHFTSISIVFPFPPHLVSTRTSTVANFRVAQSRTSEFGSLPHCPGGLVSVLSLGTA